MTSRKILILGLIGVVALVVGYGQPAQSDRPQIPTRGDWSMVGNAPVLPAGSLRKQALWNDPSVLKVDGTYVMYMTTSTKKPFEPPVLPFRAISGDGLSWRLSPGTPLLTSGGGPYVSIETPSVVQFNGTWHMFFTGIYPPGSKAPMAVGHATSANGINWKVVTWELFTAGKEGWRSFLVGEPGAVVHDGRLLVYFSAVGARAGGGPPDQSLGVSVSEDGRTFSAMKRVLTQGRAYPAKKGFAGYSSPAAVSHQGKVHLFYSVAHWLPGGNPEWTQVAIHHAVSESGTSAFREDKRAVLSYGSADWVGGEVLAPAPLIEGDQVKLWFGGHVPNSNLAPLIRRGISGPEFGIGLATARLSALGAE